MHMYCLDMYGGDARYEGNVRNISLRMGFPSNSRIDFYYYI